MRTSYRVAALLCLFASAAHAQSPYQGKWTGTATASNGSQVRVDVTIDKAGGKLRTSPQQNYTSIDQCHNRDIPLTVESQTDTELVVSIKGEKVLKGCINETATLKLIDPKTLQSTLQDGRTMKLTRK